MSIQVSRTLVKGLYTYHSEWGGIQPREGGLASQTMLSRQGPPVAACKQANLLRGVSMQEREGQTAL